MGSLSGLRENNRIFVGTVQTGFGMALEWGD